MLLTELVGYLDEYLRVPETPDHPKAHNGLQVAGTREVGRVALAVDACLATIREAVETGADVLVVHHGLFWQDPVPMTGAVYNRLRLLFQSGMGLYSCHAPLDVHPEVGNNAVLCRLLGMEPCGTWAPFEGTDVGLLAETDTTTSELRARLDDLLATNTRLISGNTDAVRKVAVLTGSGASYAAVAADLGCDTLITGEGTHHSYFVAEEAGINLFLAGHYATETLGLRALASHLESRLGLECVFIDHPTGL